MVFSSLTFIYLFLPLSLIFHYVTSNNLFRNLTLTIFSLVFYAWAEPMWIFLMIFTAMFDYSMALLVERWRGQIGSKIAVTLSIIVNIALLISYKYGGFIHDNLSCLFTLPFDRPTNSLPVGISFYTFMVISYIVDVYKGELKAQKNPLNFDTLWDKYYAKLECPYHLRLGWGSGMNGTTMGLLLNDDLRAEIRDTCGIKAPGFEAPKSRRTIRDTNGEIAFVPGWVKLQEM